MNNGAEFKNKLFKEVISKIGMGFSIYSPPYTPQRKGKIEGFHRFLKVCIGKHINYGWNGMNSHQWQQHVTISFQTAMQKNQHSSLCSEETQTYKLNMLLHSARQYFHDDNGLPNLEALKNIYQVIAQQLLNSRERYVKKHHNQQ